MKKKNVVRVAAGTAAVVLIVAGSLFAGMQNVEAKANAEADVTSEQEFVESYDEFDDVAAKSGYSVKKMEYLP